MNDCQIFSVYNFINLACQKDKNATYGPNTFTRLQNSFHFKDEFCPSNVIEYKFPGRGQKPTPCMNIRGLQYLLLILGGKVSSVFRQIIEEIFSRVMAGDTSLINIIKENAASEQPLQLAYRAALNTPIKKTVYKHDSRFFQQKREKARVSRKSSSKKASAKIRTGYVYATKSAAFPGLIKIGRTSNMKNRLIQLNTACAPKPHSVVALAPSLHCARDEKAAHKFFAERRREGEFFQVEPAEVTAYFQTSILPRYNDELQQKLCG